MPLKVYYVDDEPELLEIFSDTFASKDVHVTTFNDPEVALTEIKKNPPDVLFLDYRLPTTTGDDLAQKIDPKIPKALISGDLNLKPRSKFEMVFEKPFNAESIETFLKRFL